MKENFLKKAIGTEEERQQLLGKFAIIVMALLLFIIAGFFWGFKPVILIAGLAIALVFGLWGGIHWEKRIPFSLLCEIGVIMLIVTCFFLLALLSPLTSKAHWKLVVGILGGIFDIDLILIVLMKKKMSCKRGLKAKWKTVSQKLYDNKELFLCVVAVLFMRVFMMDTLQRWDAGEYYYALGTACSNFDFTWDSFFENFRLCAHPTLGMSFIVAIGEFLNFRGVVGVMLINLILTAAATVCLYQLFSGFFSEMKKGQAALSTLFCFSIPLVWGTFSYFNPDYYIAIFFVFYIHAEYKKHPLLLVFWGCVLSQTKETGLLLLFGYVAFRALIYFIKYEGFLNKFKYSFMDPVNLCALVPAGLYLLYAKRIGGLSSWKQSSSSLSSFDWSSTGTNCFDFRPEYILIKLKQLFVMNFAWLFFAIIALSVIVVFVNIRKKARNIVCFDHLYGIIGAMLIYVAFSCLYITAAIYRYNVCFVLFSGILVALAMAELGLFLGKKFWRIGFAAVLGLSALQTFNSVDPVSNLLVPTISTGKTKMLFSAYDSDYYGDYLVYNYQYVWLDNALNRLMRMVGYDDNTLILLPGEEHLGSHINGNGTFYRVIWDVMKQKRVLFQEEVDAVHTMDIHTKSVKSFRGESEVPHADYRVENVKDILKEKGIVVFIPYYGEDEEASLSILAEYYYVGERHVCSVEMGELIYYPLYLRQEYGGIDIERQKSETGLLDSDYIYENNEIKLADYHHLEMPDETDVTEWEVWEQICQWFQENTNYKYELQPVSDKRDILRFGDEVNITYNCYLDGVYRSEWSDTENIILGSDTMIEGFEEQLIGKQVGDKIRLQCQFPENYVTQPQLSGKPVIFEVSINAIRNELPLLNNELIWAYTEFQSVEEFQTYIRRKIEIENQKEFKIKAQKILLNQIVDASELVSYDENQSSASMIQGRTYYEQYVSSIGLDFMTWLTDYVKISETEFNDIMIMAGKRQILTKLVMERIAFKENLMPEKEKMDEVFMEILKESDPDIYKNMGYLDYDADEKENYVRNYLVKEYLWETALEE